MAGKWKREKAKARVRKEELDERERICLLVPPLNGKAEDEAGINKNEEKWAGQICLKAQDLNSFSKNVSRKFFGERLICHEQVFKKSWLD